MAQETYLTGITTTGTPHIGNYVGAIRPGIAASKDASKKNYYFLADYHALAKNEDPDKIARSTLEIAAAWMPAGYWASGVGTVGIVLTGAAALTGIWTSGGRPNPEEQRLVEDRLDV